MKLSELYSSIARSSSDDRVRNLAAQKAQRAIEASKDLDVHAHLTKASQLADRESKAHLLAYSKQDVHVDRFLPNFSINYRGFETFIADLVSPIVPVDNASNKFVVWSRRSAMALTDDEVGPLGLPGTVVQDFSSSTYSCVGRALVAKVANDIIANSDAPLELLSEAANDVRWRLLRNRELRIANQIMTAANYGGNTNALTGTARWDSTAANPINDIFNALQQASIAVQPNAAVMSKAVWTYFRKHPNVVAALAGSIMSSYGSSGGIPLGGVATVESARQLFGFDYFLVGDARQDTSNVGQASGSYSYIWGKGCALVRINPGAGMNQLAFSKTFRHQPLSFTTFQNQEPGVSGVTTVKGGFADAEQICAADSGWLIDTVIS